MHLLSGQRCYTGSGPLFEVEVVYALKDRQFKKTVSLREGATLQDAIKASGVLEEFPDLDLAATPVGVYSRREALDSLIKSGDRIELYRALELSPTEARRLRAERKRLREKEERES